MQIETGTLAYAASISLSNNQIASTTGGIVRTYAFDAAGNTTGDGTNTYTFNQRGRMSSATAPSGTTSYVYNAQGQLIEKANGGGSTFLVYDEVGHILGEYSTTGALIQETIWMGDIPVATLQPNGSGISIYYIHTDHLGTPRKITNPSTNAVVWRWDPDTFGSLAPSITTITYNLRFPGQYYQAETSLMYNYFRDYDPQTGRYVESDPTGLSGGINTYAYAFGNPVTWSDRLGLKPGDLFPSSSPGALQAAAVDALNWVYQTYGTVNAEYAGTVYLDPAGNYVATNPISQGQGATVQPSYGPGGYNAVQAYFHTHGKCLKNYDNDHFSHGYPSDLQQADWHLPLPVPSFLETPGRTILRYDPDPTRNQWNGNYSQHTTTIQSGKACPCNATQP
jgi:RHS repeat-associated protein